MPELNIPNIDLNEELKKCSSMEDLVGKNGLMQRLFGNIIQQFLEAEIDTKGLMKVRKTTETDTVPKP